MDNEIIVKFEIGTNLRLSIDKLISAYEENTGSDYLTTPAEAIRQAYGIDFTKISRDMIKSGLRSLSAEVK